MTEAELKNHLDAAEESPNSPWQNYEKRTSGDEVCGTGKMVPSADKSGEASADKGSGRCPA